MKLTFNRLVQGEVNEAVAWYNEQREQLGDELFAKLTETLDLIAVRPESFSFWLTSKTIRNAKLKRFPYSVLFEVHPLNVRILCFRHEKRHPRFGQSRI